jgi:selenide,water dikinase
VLRQLVGALPVSPDERILIGLQNAEDAAVYQLDDDRALVATLDVITPLVDDPEIYGRIAAANALSDVFAMGGKGVLSLSFLGVSPEVPPEVTVAIARGGALTAMESGAPVLGGHSVEGKDILFGLLAIGMVHPDEMFANHCLEPGDQLLLTKPLGTGTLTTAAKRDRLPREALTQAIAGMVQTNGAAVEPLRQLGVRAVTDVTGFGLLGHAAEMAKASGVQVRFNAPEVPDYPGARESLADGVITRANGRNQDYVEHLGPLEGEIEPLLLDPQTSGGLLAAVKPAQVDDALEALRRAGYGAATRIGEVAEGAGVAVLQG